MDFLKSQQHQATEKFLDTMLSNNMLLTITRPSRITKNSATLVDNILVSEVRQRSFDSCLIIDDMSDHLPTLTLLKQTRLTDKSPLIFKSRKLNSQKITDIKNKLKETDWDGILNSDDCNVNFNAFSNKLQTMMDSFAPEITMKISGKRKFTEPWMTQGIENSNNHSQKLYKKKLIRDCSDETVTAYKTYQNALNRLKWFTKRNYYNFKCLEYKSNTKKLWQLINSEISRCKHQGSVISYITIQGIKTYDPKTIANKSGQFYLELGANLAATIKPRRTSVQDYISNIPRNLNWLVINPTNPREIEKLIYNMPNKSSSGHDNVSNLLLKQLNESISYPLALIFNQSIQDGVVPERMRIAKIIPLYKGKEQDLIINYRPISLLMTICKLLEKVFYTRIYRFLEKHQILYEGQFGFCSRHSCEQAVVELVGRLLQAREQEKELPKPLQDMLESQGGRKRHRYETQNKETPNIQKHTSSQFNKSFVCKSLFKCNQLTPEIKETKKI